jgi:phenolic acid decarboxylase
MASPATVAERAAQSDGSLTRDLAGTTLTYQYEGGRRYDVWIGADTISWQRLDQPGRERVQGVPYVARRIEPGVYLLNWHRPEHTEYITILFDFNRRVMYTSGLLEGKDRHFESGRITALDRGRGADPG